MGREPIQDRTWRIAHVLLGSAIEEARAFGDALTQVGGTPGDVETGVYLEYRFADGTGNTIYIVFEPTL